nr:uncharacterized protein LOC128705478 isoform X2 [Cherax quadricarinatus]
MFVTPIAPHACGGHVKVYVRTRPLLQQEEEQGARSILAVCAANKEVVVDDAHDRPYKFEEVFEESCTQEIVFRKAVAPLVTKVKEGHNATIFAYGQTGSGKTFTMGTNPCSAKVNFICNLLSCLPCHICDPLWVTKMFTLCNTVCIRYPQQGTTCSPPCPV